MQKYRYFIKTLHGQVFWVVVNNSIIYCSSSLEFLMVQLRKYKRRKSDELHCVVFLCNQNRSVLFAANCNVRNATRNKVTTRIFQRDHVLYIVKMYTTCTPNILYYTLDYHVYGNIDGMATIWQFLPDLVFFTRWQFLQKNINIHVV